VRVPEQELMPPPVPEPEPPPVPTPSPVTPTGPIQFTGVGGAYWQVMVDGVQFSQHSAEREAWENADEARWANPGAVIEVIHNARYTVK